MKIQKFGNESFSIFDVRQDAGGMMVQFIWGKKDFRIYVSADGENPDFPVVISAAGDEFHVSKLQYLNDYEWYDFKSVVGHGLAHEDVQWKFGKLTRYVELPKDFLEIALDIACREFGLQRKAG